jgi:protein-disulfide isomerase
MPSRSSGLAWLVHSCAASLAFLALSCAATRPPPSAVSAEARVVSAAAVPSSVDVPAPPGEDGAAVPISTSDAVWGSRRALVSLVVFGDFECPYTGKILKTVQVLEAKYGPADLRVVWKNQPLPFHPQARPVAEAAAAVLMLGQNDAFWRFWEQALTHQTELTAAAAESWASAAGVDLASYRRLVEAHAGQAKVDADVALADRLRVTGTPTFFVNGVALLGAQPVESFTKVIDEEIAKAKGRLLSGVAPDALYVDVARANWKEPTDDTDSGADEKEDSTTVWSVPLGNAPVRGGAAALVTIVEFSDFQCPYCKLVEPTLKKIREMYGDKVRIVWRDEPLPFHPQAMPAAELAREARAEKGDAGFWAAHDAIFDSQPKLADDDLASVARVLGLNAARVKRAIADRRYEAQIKADVDLSAAVGASGTPHFFINGRRLVGAQPLKRFEEVIDEEVRHAEGLLAKGTARKALYDTMMKAAVTTAAHPPK